MEVEMAKAYLMLTINVQVMPMVIVHAETFSAPLASLSGLFCKAGEAIWEVLSVEGVDYQDARDRLVRMVEGKEFCPNGDLRSLSPFIPSSEEAHKARYHLRKEIDASVAAMPRYATAPQGRPEWFTGALTTGNTEEVS
jgi:hypothetical protein